MFASTRRLLFNCQQLKRCYSSIRDTEQTVRLPTGEEIPCPVGAIKGNIKGSNVFAYGENAVKAGFIVETSEKERLHNIARTRYLEARSRLMDSEYGSWVAINPKGTYITAQTEEKVRQMANENFPEGFYASSVGCEVFESTEFGW